MPDPKQVSGVPLPAQDVPAGTVIVRVIRGSFANNLADQPVEFIVDGTKRTVRTDESGRARIDGLKPGAKVQASTRVGSERLESQEISIGDGGIRVVLVATDPEAAKREEEDRQLAGGPPVRGVVALGPETRVVLDPGDGQVSVFYKLDILNTARTPVELGGPLVIDLPRGARGATILEGSSKQAIAKGPRITVTGPFAPGSTTVDVQYELPSSGVSTRIEQRWPATLQMLTVLVFQPGGVELRSPSLTATREITDQGQRLIVGAGPAIAAGQTSVLDLSGLPHHAMWPRYVALALAGGVMSLGIWAAIFVGPRRRTA